MEILIMDANDNGVFEREEIIDIRPTGFEWGAFERDYPFRIIRLEDDAIPGETLDEKRAWVLEPLLDPSDTDPETGGMVRPSKRRFRRNQGRFTTRNLNPGGGRPIELPDTAQVPFDELPRKNRPPRGGVGRTVRN